MKKVIIDTDMVEGFDDGVALLMLEKALNVEVIGVTTVSGNTNVKQASATAIKQLEIINSSTPVYEGSFFPLDKNRYDIDFLKKEESLVGKINYAGYLSKLFDGVSVDIHQNYKDYYFDLYNEKCLYKNIYFKENFDNNNAVDFLIDQANKHPNEISILAIGPLTNIAKAILKDSTFSSKIKEIVYMGGAFYLDGNSTKNAEFNWWIDPLATKICINSNWGESTNDYNNQIIFSLLSAKNTKAMPQKIYDKILEDTYPEFKKLLIKTSGYKAPINIWDVIAASYIIDEKLVLSWNEGVSIKKGVYIDCKTKLNKNYAKVKTYDFKKNKGMKKAIIANKIDSNLLFEKLLYPLLKK